MQIPAVLELPVGTMQANCYLVSDPITRETVIVDPGDDAEYIKQNIQDHHLTPVRILATHGHFDHVMAATELSLTYGIPFAIHVNDEFLLANMEASAYHFLHIHPGPPPPVSQSLSEKTPVAFGKVSLAVLEVPGHTPGSICLYHEAAGMLFTGDLLFADGGVGRTDFSYSNRGKLKHSLIRIFKLPSRVAIYPGHGQASTLAREIVHHPNLAS